MLGDSGVVRCSIHAKHGFVDLFLGEGLPGMKRQILTDSVLRAGQRQFFFCVGRRFARHIKAHPATHHPVYRNTILPPQMGRDPRPQFAHPEGLG